VLSTEYVPALTRASGASGRVGSCPMMFPLPSRMKRLTPGREPPKLYGLSAKPALDGDPVTAPLEFKAVRAFM
jgi:hypothetical protein